MKQQVITLLTISMILTALTGCGGSNTEAFLNDIEQLKAENSQLSEKVDTLEKENAQLRQQAMTLSSLKREVRMELIDTLAEIKIGDRTGLFDKDNDGTSETLVVYVTPLDGQQDSIKAVGQCQVELWDLSRPEDQAKIFSDTFKSDCLYQNWGGNIFNSYYRLELDSKDIINYRFKQKTKQLTVRVTFTDYIGGKVLIAQKVINLD